MYYGHCFPKYVEHIIHVSFKFLGKLFSLLRILRRPKPCILHLCRTQS